MGEGPVAQLIAARFRKALKRYGLDAERAPLDRSRFTRPLETAEQPSLF